MRYLYAMRLRPFSLGTYPKKGFVRAEINVDVDSCNYHDLLIYDRRLKDEEVKEWEFEYLGEFEDEI